MERIYFDNASTTAPSQKVMEGVARQMAENIGNPSSLHRLGLESEKEVKSAAGTIAAILGAQPEEVFFTSGGTESNNLAIIGTALKNRRKNHLITAATEHPSVLEPFMFLESQGFQVTVLETDPAGHVNIEALQAALTEKTALVSIMHVNNETGTVNDIDAIGKTVKKSGALFHVDGVQSFGKLPVSIKDIDLFTLSGHKIHAVKGIGALYIKKGTKISPMVFGGGQQKAIRPGTENTMGILSLKLAAEEAWNSREVHFQRAAAVKSRMLELLTALDETFVNGDGMLGSPYILNLSFIGVRSEVLLHALEEEGIFVSAGSACASNKPASRLNAIAAMGLPRERYESAIRFSFCHGNTVEEADRCIEAVIKQVVLLRKYRKRSCGSKSR